MSDVRIDFMIYEEYPLTHGCADGAQGGVRIVIDGIVVTRSEAPKHDEEFRGGEFSTPFYPIVSGPSRK